MNIRKNIAASENGFIFNAATGDSYSANGIASMIMMAMNAGKTELDRKGEIPSVYEVGPDQLNRDWDDYMGQLRDTNLLEV